MTNSHSKFDLSYNERVKNIVFNSIPKNASKAIMSYYKNICDEGSGFRKYLNAQDLFGKSTNTLKFKHVNKVVIQKNQTEYGVKKFIKP